MEQIHYINSLSASPHLLLSLKLFLLPPLLSSLHLSLFLFLPVSLLFSSPSLCSSSPHFLHILLLCLSPSSPLPLSLISSPSSSSNSLPIWPLIRGERRRIGSGWCWFSESFCSEMDQSSGLKRWWITTLIISSSSATHTLGEVIRYEWCSPIFPIPPLPSAPLLFWIRRGPTNCCGQKKKTVRSNTCRFWVEASQSCWTMDNSPFFLLLQQSQIVPLIREIQKIKAAWNVEPVTEYSCPWASPRLKLAVSEHKTLFWIHWFPVTGA